VMATQALPAIELGNRWQKSGPFILWERPNNFEQLVKHHQRKIKNNESLAP
jgi:hypothetical protein